MTIEVAEPHTWIHGLAKMVIIIIYGTPLQSARPAVLTPTFMNESIF